MIADSDDVHLSDSEAGNTRSDSELETDRKIHLSM